MKLVNNEQNDNCVTISPNALANNNYILSFEDLNLTR